MLPANPPPPFLPLSPHCLVPHRPSPTSSLPDSTTPFTSFDQLMSASHITSPDDHEAWKFTATVKGQEATWNVLIQVKNKKRIRILEEETKELFSPWWSSPLIDTTSAATEINSKDQVCC